jgi:hypothetical protein
MGLNEAVHHTWRKYCTQLMSTGRHVIVFTQLVELQMWHYSKLCTAVSQRWSPDHWKSPGSVIYIYLKNKIIHFHLEANFVFLFILAAIYYNLYLFPTSLLAQFNCETIGILRIKVWSLWFGCCTFQNSYYPSIYATDIKVASSLRTLPQNLGIYACYMFRPSHSPIYNSIILDDG